MVAWVGGRARGLVQAVRMIQREGGEAGRALQDLQMAPDIGMRPRIQKVGPHGQEIQRRLGGLQAWERRNQIIDNAPETTNTPDNQQSPRRDLE